MRRRQSAETTTPQRLRRYVAEEWADDPQAWYDAREAWARKHPDVPMVVQGPWPDAPFDPATI